MAEDKSPEAAGRLENLKELVRSMEEFPDLAAFLEHIALVMDVDNKRWRRTRLDHDAARREGTRVRHRVLPGWEEGALSASARPRRISGRAGLEEERRLAYVGITRAKLRARIFFATNRRIRGLWQTTIPSRFLDELPAAHVDVVEAAQGSNYGGYAQSRFANMDSYGSTYNTPGWQRAQARRNETGGNAGGRRMGQGLRPGVRTCGRRAAWPDADRRRACREILGRLVVQGRRAASSTSSSAMARVATVDGNKLTVDFDKAGRKMVLESFVSAP